MEEISSLFQRFLRKYQRNEVIFEEGTKGEEMFIIRSGKVRISKKSKEGAAITLATLEQGEFFDEMALIDRSARSASTVAEEDNTTLIVLDTVKFIYMVQQLPDFSLTVMRKLCQRLRETNTQTVRHQHD